ncbi:MAG: CIA30 family protein [Verrucomicrobiota bacterium]
MKSSHSVAALLARVHLLLRWMPSLLLLLPPFTGSASAEGVAWVLDDYSDPKLNRYGVERLLIDDRTAGSKSKATLSCEKGILRVQGDLVPGRGVPAFISQVSLLAPEGKARDLSGYQGIRLRVKVIKGILCVQIGSTEITNFDYHTSAPIAGGRGEFQEVRMPFKDMKRAWSEPTALNLGSITSVNLVSFGMARDAFAYEVDELGFY